MYPDLIECIWVLSQGQFLHGSHVTNYMSHTQQQHLVCVLTGLKMQTTCFRLSKLKVQITEIYKSQFIQW